MAELEKDLRCAGVRQIKRTAKLRRNFGNLTLGISHYDLITSYFDIKLPGRVWWISQPHLGACKIGWVRPWVLKDETLGLGISKILPAALLDGGFR